MSEIVTMQQRYTAIARCFHWIVAVLLAVQVALGLLADGSRPPQMWRFLDPHVQLGITIMGLAVLRLAWRIAHPPPPLPTATPRWQSLAAAAVHRALYALILLLPMTGYALWMWDKRPLRLYGMIPLPLVETEGISEYWRSLAGYGHEWGFYLLCALLALHIGAAAWHELVLRDGLIRERML